MNRSNIYNKVKSTRRWALCGLLLWMFAGSAMAQSDSPYVIKVKDQNHYLAHVYNESTHQWEVTDATTFSPNCLWYSGIEQNVTGTNHNYYFDDGTNLRFLSAPMVPNGLPSLSSSLPPTYLLSNTDTLYYFYDWDTDNGSDGGGVARGHQYYGYTQQQCTDCGSSWGDNQCWRVYWIAYKEGTGWKLTHQSYYDITNISGTEDGIGGRYRKVTATPTVTPVSGGLADLTGFAMDYTSPYSQHSLSASVTLPYSYKAYTLYSFVESSSTSNHYYYNNADHTSAPTAATGSGTSVSSYEWTLSGPGADYLSFSSGSMVSTSSIAAPTLYYRVENSTGDKDATLKLVVTYNDGSKQESTAVVTAKTACQNPPQAAAPVVNYNDVTVTWYDIATKYQLQWKTTGASEWNTPMVVNSVGGNTISYRVTDLLFNTNYEYRVTAFCNGDYLTPPTTSTGTFKTEDEPDLLIYGSVFGGGRVANVNGTTEVIIVNCDSIGAVYGGNDIAGEVKKPVNGNGGSSSIILGVNSGDSNASYGTTSAPLTVGAVYGGGNGYYAYGGNEFHAATSSNYNTVPVNAKVYALSPSGQWNDSVWINTGSTALPLPTISSTAITVANDYVKVDTVFGGAKNAFLTASTGNGSSVILNGGTFRSVFGGNNVGGSQGAAKQYVKVDEGQKTTTTNYQTRIHTLFGSGNMVDGSSTDILVNGGQIDTLYAGGNSASVATEAKVTINCSLASGSGSTFGHTYSDAIASYSNGTITVKDSYPWNGTGTYNVRTLFGGNNKADMAVVPNIVLTSGSVGTVYGGGNAGNMNAAAVNSGIAADFGDLVIQGTTYDISHSTHVVLNSPNMLIDYLYGGCQISDVYHSTWVEMSNGHVGTVYGGCNISGDVGSRYLFSDGWDFRPRHERYQAVQGATYVKVSGGHIYKDLFAGSNGRYHCNNGKYYVSGINFDDLDSEGNYLGMSVPSHNETHVFVSGGEVDGSVYAGGNLACVGFINESVPDNFYTPVFVGMASVRMNGGHVHGNVFGGGNMASIWGSNSVKIEGGSIDGALYGGNDRIGLVAQITNRVLPSDYGFASDGHTSLADVRTYISLTGRPDIETVYGGGNGDYDYTVGQYCNPNDQPVQSNTFVDVNIDGFADGNAQGGHINTVYGGGNGVTVTGSTTVFLNVKGQNGGEPTAYAHVGTIFGGNNKGSLAILPNIVLLKGQVDTIYGGCNQGSMIGSHSVGEYTNVGSLVYLRNAYVTEDNHTATPTAVVRKAAYGGCRMNGVDNNSLVLVERGDHGVTESGVFNGASFFGGSDISGTIGGKSQVVLTGGQVGSIYGGGNGNYSYTGALAGLTAPTCATSRVDILGGQVGTDADHTANVYGGGLGAGTSTTGDVNVTVDGNTANVWGDVYGGSALGNVNTSNANHTNVTLASGTIHGDLYGGGHGDADNAAAVNGAVQVTVNGGSVTGSVYGCNNVNGAPQSTVNVDIYGTDMPSSGYALGKVFGGGNQAAYNNKPIVTVHNCDNKIEYVYGGGNAANVKGTDVTIYGGNTIGNVFGGCYGADVTADGTDVKIHGGTIGEVYGGNNASGTVTGAISVNVNKQPETQNGTACAMHIGEVYGGGNLAASQAGTITIGCTGTGDDEGIGDVYGGANQADITSGNIVLNINEGRINSVFGGNNNGGSIAGDITVNIEKANDACVWNVNEVFGGGNLAVYGGTPTVNIKNGAVANVFGGGNGDPTSTSHEPGQVAGSVVNIGDNVTGHLAEVTGNVYGGGNAANVAGNTLVNFNSGDVKSGIYGGCNTKGTISGDIAVNILNNLGATGEGGYNVNVFGGGLGHETHTSGDVNVTIGTANSGDNSPVLYGNVYGGSAKGYVNSGSDDVTKVWLRSGTVNGRLFGGGLGDNDHPAEVNGGVQVLVDDGVVTTAVYGCNDQNGTPKDTVNVRINGGVVKNVIGGGNLAAYTPTTSGNYPAIYIAGGEVTHKVVGGGNAANVNGNPVINISNGLLCTGNPTEVGIYGGCNETGSVNGDITLNITGDATHQTTIGTQAAVEARIPINVFGGGYGAGTSTTGNVTVNYGSDSNTECDYPKLYGDLYGGSALGSVNDAEADKTTVNIKNGSFGYFAEMVNNAENQYGGSIYGGGLGQKTGVNGATSDIAAMVNGEVHVNIGQATNPGDEATYSGLANLYHCSVYGCNNVNGSPQHDVFVDVYKTYHPAGTGVSGDLFAITNVFGGGNRADYRPVGSPNTTNSTGHKTHVYVHGCENTVRYVYGGGNAAFAEGAITLIDGGHFDEVFGGGNGLVTAADIGHGGICLQAFGGHVNFLYEGSNKLGANYGVPRATYTLYTEPNDVPAGWVNCGDLFVDYWFFGDNEAEHIGDLENTITCAQAEDFHFRNVYAGSRWAVIYGDVKLTVRGGTIENLFGGSRGYNDQNVISADIRKYPTLEQYNAAPAGYYSQAVHDTIVAHPERCGTGGNVILNIQGGTVGNIFGGCDVMGNVEGKITVTVNANDTVQANCPLFVGNVYGASNMTEYQPVDSCRVDSPDVQIQNGTVGGTATFQSGAITFEGNVFGGGNEGKITSNPKVTIGYTDNTKSATVNGNVYGGGNAADVEGNTKVLLQGNAEVKTNVFGGGKSADVKGSTQVLLGEQ